MVISEKYAKQLVRAGKARLDGHTTDAVCWDFRAQGQTYMIVTRFDLQRVDHYLAN